MPRRFRHPMAGAKARIVPINTLESNALPLRGGYPRLARLRHPALRSTLLSKCSKWTIGKFSFFGVSEVSQRGGGDPLRTFTRQPRCCAAARRCRHFPRRSVPGSPGHARTSSAHTGRWVCGSMLHRSFPEADIDRRLWTPLVNRDKNLTKSQKFCRGFLSCLGG